MEFCLPRTELLELAYRRLTGDDPDKTGHYITVWAPRQAGKSWLLARAMWRIRDEGRFDCVKINLEHLKGVEEGARILRAIANDIGEALGREDFNDVDTKEKFQNLFKKTSLKKPLILILDEFDALHDDCINMVVGAFRNIYNHRREAGNVPAEEKPYLLHGVALIGVRSVLGIENKSGSPFNVQRSIHVDCLSEEEVVALFQQYQDESGQKIEPEVVARIYKEARGQPGLTGWFGELLTEQYNDTPDRPITLKQCEFMLKAAEQILPNANIVNLISKANQPENRELLLELFRTATLPPFKFDDPRINSLYMNGVIEPVRIGDDYYMRFPNPFVQRRLFNRYAYEMFSYMGQLVEPLRSLDDVITKDGLNVRNLLARYQLYLNKNASWLFQKAPRRTDLRIQEPVYHFNLYMYLFEFLRDKGGRIFPEFPTGNGQIDILIEYEGRTHGIEVKSFRDGAAHAHGLKQAAKYGKQLGLSEITLAVFIEAIDDENRRKLETDYNDPTVGAVVKPVFVETAAAERGGN